jgi:poly(3-hydroxybutyrate) depolymerase
MYEPIRFDFATTALLWPAIAAGSISDMAAFAAKQFADMAVGERSAAVSEPEWANAHTIALELKTARLRDFADGPRGEPVLLCAPLAVHSAAIADFERDHSLVAALRHAGLSRLLVTDWRSANRDMRYLGTDDYLADLNVMVDEIGAPVHLIGLCQGGWMALLYAARFPNKVRKLVLAGAPIDISAAPSSLSAAAEGTPLEIFRELVRLGDGLVPGRRLLRFWGPGLISFEDIKTLLQIKADRDVASLARIEARFRDWYSWAIDLPGTFFLEVVEKLYKQNELATGKFVALGRQIDLATVRAPIFMLAARDDELVAPEQLFAIEHLVGTPAYSLRKAIAPCRHLGLFMGERTLEEIWPKIAQWLREPEAAILLPRVAAPAT